MNNSITITLVGVVDNDLISIKNSRGWRVALHIVKAKVFGLDIGNILDREPCFEVEALGELAGYAYGNLIEGSRVLVEGEMREMKVNGKGVRTQCITATRLENLDF